MPQLSLAFFAPDNALQPNATVDTGWRKKGAIMSKAVKSTIALLVLVYASVDYPGTAEATDLANIIAEHSRKCLGVVNGSMADNAPVHQFDCDGSDEQTFVLIPLTGDFFNIVAKHSGKCLDIPNGDTANNTPLNQFQCDGSDDQQFRLRPLEGFRYNIVARHSDKCLDVPNANKSNNVQLVQFSCDGSKQQRFLIQAAQ